MDSRQVQAFLLILDLALHLPHYPLLFFGAKSPSHCPASNHLQKSRVKQSSRHRVQGTVGQEEVSSWLDQGGKERLFLPTTLISFYHYSINYNLYVNIVAGAA